jgi:ribosomal protein S12 methylthiotransferase accessory factor
VSVDPGRSDPHPPLRYAGRELRASKDFVYGTHRAMPPEETLARIRPHLPEAGITRVADITSLDTVGVPVAVAIRPASGTLAVEGGKGATHAAAFTSAAMEALERYVAETDPLIDVTATAADVADLLPVPADAFPMMRFASIAPRHPYHWTRVWDLRDGREHVAPRDLVILPTGDLDDPFRFPWAAGSNGLASGNHLPEAICAALYEVIERDATSCWQVAHAAGGPQLVIDPATIEGPAIRRVLDTLDRAGVDAIIHWCPTEIGVPTAMAFVVDRRARVGIYKGYGCHLDPEIALVRAVSEAVQGRTIFVAGARDDLLRSSYEALKRSDVFTVDEFLTNARMISLDDVPNRATPTFHGDIAVMLESLEPAGFPHVLARARDAARFEGSVARVIVPGLETYRWPWVTTSSRARAFDPAAVTPLAR